ncbi:aminotransferase-like domain-containing protein [Limnoglobus roseus]|uniref:PLP-dependent aminotransferase family protein n=1 Tax=Limnoglobus roseus TaxID=2598579 RepID=A0A5C1AJL7_9BACT|nr:PLP-dependent aminotransferase family protein [Limnoglobus roseus]QEL19060.1 PLP-dependent aminotransferase family protein [Limnoglobus roseus]
MPPALSLSSRSLRTADSPISYFIQKAIETPGLISLAAGLVDESAFPSAEIAQVVAEMMANPATAKAALQYGSTQGLPALRARVLDRVCTADGVKPSDINLTLGDVVLTTGSQQMLYLLGEVLIEPGDIVLAEAPSYFVYHDCLKSHGAKVIGVPMDDGGMCLKSLEKELIRLELAGELKKVKLIYTVDYFQNPTGLTLARDRRPKLVELAKRFSKHHRILILEDAAYRELRYDGDDITSIKRFDTTNEYVIYTTTFSKPCSPGLKTGYSLLPNDLVAPVCNLKGNHDFGSSNLAQHILNRLLETGAFDRHLVRLREVYRSKRDAMLTAIATEFASCPGVRWNVPAGGLYVWMTFPSGTPTGKGSPLVEAAVSEGVLYIPGNLGHVPNEQGKVPDHEIRLSFGVAEPSEIAEGVRRLRRAYAELETSKRGARESVLT